MDRQAGRTILGQRAKGEGSGNWSHRLGPWAHREGSPATGRPQPCRREPGDPNLPLLPPYPISWQNLSAGANQRAKGKEALRMLLKLIVIKGPGHQARFCWSKGGGGQGKSWRKAFQAEGPAHPGSFKEEQGQWGCREAGRRGGQRGETGQEDSVDH